MRTTGEHKRTPDKLYGWANKRWGPFTLDAAADRHNAKCKRYFKPKQNALKQKWTGRVWLNPPWDDIEPFVRKAYDAVFIDKTATLVTMLLPAGRTGQPWYQHWVKPYAEVRKDVHGPGRVHFGKAGKKNGKGGFEDCSLFVFELPLTSRQFDDD